MKVFAWMWSQIFAHISERFIFEGLPASITCAMQPHCGCISRGVDLWTFELPYNVESRVVKFKKTGVVATVLRYTFPSTHTTSLRKLAPCLGKQAKTSSVSKSIRLARAPLRAKWAWAPHVLGKCPGKGRLPHPALPRLQRLFPAIKQYDSPYTAQILRGRALSAWSAPHNRPRCFRAHVSRDCRHAVAGGPHETVSRPHHPVLRVLPRACPAWVRCSGGKRPAGISTNSTTSSWRSLRE